MKYTELGTISALLKCSTGWTERVIEYFYTSYTTHTSHSTVGSNAKYVYLGSYNHVGENTIYLMQVLSTSKLWTATVHP